MLIVLHYVTLPEFFILLDFCYITRILLCYIDRIPLHYWNSLHYKNSVTLHYVTRILLITLPEFDYVMLY